jgi:hypothetical protein
MQENQPRLKERTSSAERACDALEGIVRELRSLRVPDRQARPAAQVSPPKLVSKGGRESRLVW